MMLSDICLSVAHIEPKLRTERPRKKKIGREVAHDTRDSDTTFKVKRSPGHFTHCSIYASAVAMETYSPWEPTATLRSGAVGLVAQGALAPRGVETACYTPCEA